MSDGPPHLETAVRQRYGKAAQTLEPEDAVIVRGSWQDYNLTTDEVAPTCQPGGGCC